MAVIHMNLDRTEFEAVDSKPPDCALDLPNLQLRLALEGVEVVAPVYGNLIRVSHPQHGVAHFNSWGTVYDHCNENWKTTYWGPTVGGMLIDIDRDIPVGYTYFIGEGGLDDADSRTDSRGGGVPVSARP